VEPCIQTLHGHKKKMENEYEILIQEISSYRSDETILLILDFFRKLEFEGKKFPYWYLLSLIQLTAEYSSTSKLLLNPSYQAIKRMGQRVEKIQSDYVLNNFGMKGSNLRKSMSIIMHQQFWQFTNIPESDITKQRFLFNHPTLEKLFEEMYGLSMHDFLDLSMFGYLYIENKDISKFHGFLDSKYIACIEHFKGEEIAAKYLNAISITDSKPLKEQFVKASKVESGIYKMFDFSYLITKPIFHIKNVYRIYTKQIFYNSLKYFVYNSLKNQKGFGETFGKICFENYIELGLKDRQIEYKKENQIQKFLPKGSKSVDFIIEDEIFVECKATELVAHSAIRPTDESLKKSLKSSIIKGFKQIIETSNKLKKKDCIGIIVTYKNVRLDGGDALDEILTDRFQWFCEEELKVLKRENFFIFSIDDWDLIVSSVDVNLKEIIKGIILKKGEQRKQLIDYLKELGKQDKPYSFLQEKYSEFKNN